MLQYIVHAMGYSHTALIHVLIYSIAMQKKKKHIGS